MKEKQELSSLKQEVIELKKRLNKLEQADTLDDIKLTEMILQVISTNTQHPS